MKNFFQEFIWVAFSKGFAGAGAILINLVIMQRLGPAALGAYSLCMAGILLADGVIGSAFDVAVLKLATQARTEDPGKSYNLELAALLMKLVMILFASAVAILFARTLSLTFFHNATSMNLIIAGCTAAVGLLAMRSIQVHLQIDRRFAAYGGLDLIHSCLRFGGIGLVLWSLSPSPTAIVTMVAAAPLIVSIVSLAMFGKSIVSAKPGLWAASWELADFVKWSLLTTTVATIGRQLDVLLLSSRADIVELGIYSGGQIFSVIPDMFGMYLSVIISPRIMRYLQDGSFFAFYRKVQRALLIAALAALVVGLLGVDMVRQYVLPAQYAQSANVLAILWPGALAGTVSFPLAIGFVMFVRPTFLFKLELIILPLTAVFYLVAIDQYGAIGAAWVTSISRIVKAFIVGVVAWHCAKASLVDTPSNQLTDNKL